MPTRRFSGTATAASEPDNGGDNSGGGGSGTYVDDVFSTYLYEGTGAGVDNNIVNGIDLEGEGGLVWIKSRTTAYGHALIDTKRGGNSSLDSSNNGPQQIGYAPIAFNSDGFTCTDTGQSHNAFQTPYASWTWRKSPKFFDVVTYTGDNNGLTIPHNLGVEPGMIIIKNISLVGQNYHVYNKSLGINKSLALNLNTKEQGFDSMASPPTDKTFTLIGGRAETCVEPHNYVAYLFAQDDSDESLIKCGSFTTPADGTTRAVVELGWEPQWVLTKSSSTSDDWQIIDSMRGITGSQADPALNANSPNAEANIANAVLTSTGFEISRSANQDYIYMAIRRPNKPAEEFEPDGLFAIDTPSGTNAGDVLTSGFVDDTIFQKYRSLKSGFTTASRLTGKGILNLSSNDDENLSQDRYGFDVQDGVEIIIEDGAYDMLYYHFKRARGFFDVVCYEGDGQIGHDVPHNLGVAPKMIWVKSRSNLTDWSVYHHGSPAASNGGTANLVLQGANAASTGSKFWPTKHTEADFKLGDTDAAINRATYTYIAYLFATVPGISKVGSYTGTGADLDIDCGFTTGARFVLIKRTDATGDWYVWDTLRGITVGNDPYLLLNTTDAEVTNTDYIDPLSSGFKVTASAPDAINAANGNYIFYAIA